MSVDRAAEAIFTRAAALAEEANAETLVELADAVSRLAYGPQGGTTRYHYVAVSRTDSTTKQVYDGNGRDGRTAGFGA